MEDPGREHRTTRRRALDLSVVQVAASALAAVVAAVLASELGVYGTIAGAAVVSIGATIGGAVFQHLFRRTGEQIRSRVPVVASGPVSEREQRANVRVDAEAAFDGLDRFDPFDPGGERTRMLAAVAPPQADAVGTYRAGGSFRARSWKGYALLTALVFALAMGTVTVAELVAGKPLAAVVRNESGSGTSWGGSAGHSPSDPDRTPAQDPSGGTGTDPGGSSVPAPSGTPSAGTGGGSSATPSAPPTGGATSSPATSAPSTPPATGGGSAGTEGVATAPPSP